MIYAFIESRKANHRISRMCKALKVSKSGFYDWRDRAPSARARADALLLEKISSIHTDSRETYGADSAIKALHMSGAVVVGSGVTEHFINPSPLRSASSSEPHCDSFSSTAGTDMCNGFKSRSIRDDHISADPMAVVAVADVWEALEARG